MTAPAPPAPTGSVIGTAAGDKRRRGWTERWQVALCVGYKDLLMGSSRPGDLSQVDPVARGIAQYPSPRSPRWRASGFTCCNWPGSRWCPPGW